MGYREYVQKITEKIQIQMAIEDLIRWWSDQTGQLIKKERDIPEWIKKIQ